ncbi:adenosylhomocysteinase-like isoform X3 [Eucalyptus grandis]|uniref:adenosylhomocysteinase-like isoform X3 n=1 Tax=Eucalyptus grandis TaxID=71139 RepID=UPI00192EE9C1|nr:adenosylhomocysteinase-like isoform X3 [Eucalyptus grandis]
MALSVQRTASRRECKVKDMLQADFGLLEIELAAVQMPALMSCRSVFGPSQPLKGGARITGFLHVTTQTAVLIETLKALGADVRWCSSNAFSTQDHAAAAIARDSAGVKAEEAYESTGNLPDPASTDNAELQFLLTIIRDGLETDPQRYRKMKERLVGVSEATATTVERLYGMQADGTLLFPVINVNDSVTKTKFQNLCGCRPCGPDGLLMATDVEIAGKVAVVCGYGDVGKDCATALKKSGACVIVTEIDPIRALQALMEGILVLTLEDVVSEADIFAVTAGGSKGIITVDHMRKMKNNAIVGNIGPFNNAMDMPGLETFPGVKRITFNPQTDRWVFPDTQSGVIVLAEGRLVNLGCTTGHPRLATASCSFANHVMAQLELWMERETGKYEKKVYALPKHLDERVAALHLDKLGAKLTELSKEHTD